MYKFLTRIALVVALLVHCGEGALTDELASLIASNDVLEMKIGAVDVKLGDVESMVASTKTDVAAVKTDVSATAAKIDTNFNKLVDVTTAQTSHTSLLNDIKTDVADEFSDLNMMVDNHMELLHNSTDTHHAASASFEESTALNFDALNANVNSRLSAIVAKLDVIQNWVNRISTVLDGSSGGSFAPTSNPTVAVVPSVSPTVAPTEAAGGLVGTEVLKLNYVDPSYYSQLYYYDEYANNYTKYHSGQCFTPATSMVGNNFFADNSYGDIVFERLLFTLDTDMNYGMRCSFSTYTTDEAWGVAVGEPIYYYFWPLSSDKQYTDVPIYIIGTAANMKNATMCCGCSSPGDCIGEATITVSYSTVKGWVNPN